MKFVRITIISAFLLNSVINLSRARKNCFRACDRHVAPVCGKSGKTHRNRCILDCETDDTFVSNGECTRRQCMCMDDGITVCATNGITYPSRCQLGCNNATFNNKRKCKEEIDCQKMRCQNHRHHIRKLKSQNQLKIPKTVCGEKREYKDLCEMCRAGDFLQYIGTCRNEDLPDKEDKPKIDGCSCITVYHPICGENGKTYSNGCFAKCAGVRVKYEDKCENYKPVRTVCPIERKPVCGIDDKTYSNKYEAKDAGVRITYLGECDAKLNCVCPKINIPVCTTDGETFPNICMAECKGKVIKHKGRCRPRRPCLCNRKLHYVCGMDGKTYNNPCYPKCYGIEIDYEGKCDKN